MLSLNNLHQVRSKSKDWKAKKFKSVFWSNKTKWLKQDSQNRPWSPIQFILPK
jgi:hypothetical protein